MGKHNVRRQGKRVLKEKVDHAGESGLQINTTGALTITDMTNGATMLLDQNGNIQTETPPSLLGISIAPTDAFIIQDGDENTQLAFSNIFGLLTVGSIQANQTGALTITEEYTSTTQLAVGPTAL